MKLKLKANERLKRRLNNWESVAVVFVNKCQINLHQLGRWESNATMMRDRGECMEGSTESRTNCWRSSSISINSVKLISANSCGLSSQCLFSLSVLV